jgi:hypothetical protein
VTWTPYTGSVFVGTNEFGNCGVVISIEGAPLFQFYTSSNGGFAVDLHVKDPATRTDSVLIQRDATAVLPAGATYTNQGGVAELRWNSAVIFRAQYTTTAVRVTMDLRPLRVNLYTVAGDTLHIGGNRVTMSRCRIFNSSVGLWIPLSFLRMG